MQKFCLMTVVEQAGHMTNLTSRQKKVLEGLEKLLQKMNETSVNSPASVNSDEFNLSFSSVYSIHSILLLSNEQVSDVISL